MRCKICSAETTPFDTAVVLRKYSVRYFRCPRCAFIQTESPYWLKEAYEKAIVDIDLGVVNRSYTMADKCQALLLSLFSPGSRFVDYGAGYGMFVRRMRDVGFNFYHHDKYADNIFARGFEAQPGDTYSLLTAFEVFEHLAEPREDLATMLSFAPSIFFSTELVPEPAPRPHDWWYYVLDYGQHVALYSRRSLEVLAAEHGLRLYSDGVSLHLMTRKRFHPLLFRFLMKRRGGALARVALAWRRRQVSLLPADFAQASGYQTHRSTRS